jgi:hypothetical protein
VPIVIRLYHWYLRQHLLSGAIFAAGMVYGGIHLGTAVPSVAPQTAARTLNRTYTQARTRFVTVHVRGRVLHRYDHVLVVYVPRTVFHTRTVPSRRIVVPAHVVRIKRREMPVPPFGATSLIVGVTPPPVTIDVPVTITVPGPTTTVTGPTTTDVTTETDTQTVTVTVTVPLPPPEGTQ